MQKLILAVAVAIVSISGASFANDPADCSTTDGVKVCRAKSEYIAIQACGTKAPTCEITDNGNYWTCTCTSSVAVGRPGSLKSNVKTGIVLPALDKAKVN